VPETDKWVPAFFKHRHFDIRIGDLPDVQISLNFAHQQIGTQRATSLFVSSSKSQRIASYKFWDKFKFEASMNFKGIQTFLKKSDKLYKFHIRILYLIINLH
jgi:hypothetical protein